MYTVYRIEHPLDGEGPFRSNHCQIEDDHDDFSKYPSWENDFPYYEDVLSELKAEDTWDLLSGVIYPCHLLYWFGEEFNTIVENFNIYLIKVEKVVISKSRLQVIFKKEDIIEKTIIHFKL